MKRLAILFLAVFLVFSISSCTQRMIDFTIISSKNVQLGSTIETGPSSEGEDWKYMILFIPTGQPSMEEAVDRAIESAGPQYDALTDGVLYYKYYYFLLGAKYGYTVKGIPVNTKTLTQTKDGAEEPMLYHSRLNNENGENLSKEGYKRLCSSLPLEHQKECLDGVQ